MPKLPRKKRSRVAKSAVAKRSKRQYDYDAAWQPDLLWPPIRQQRALPLGQPIRQNYLRHVSEYLRRQRAIKPLATSYPKTPAPVLNDQRRETLCKRRQARKEVLFAKGQQTGKGTKVRYRQKPVKGLDCKKSRH